MRRIGDRCHDGQTRQDACAVTQFIETTEVQRQLANNVVSIQKLGQVISKQHELGTTGIVVKESNKQIKKFR